MVAGFEGKSSIGMLNTANEANKRGKSQVKLLLSFGQEICYCLAFILWPTQYLGIHTRQLKFSFAPLISDYRKHGKIS